MMGNKGAVSVRFKLGQTAIRIVNVHFHSGQSNVETRNQDFNETFANFCRPEKPTTVKGNKIMTAPVESEQAGISDDVLIFMGDLNYRINGNAKSVLQLMNKDLYEILRYNDQLFIEMKIGTIP